MKVNTSPNEQPREKGQQTRGKKFHVQSFFFAQLSTLDIPFPLPRDESVVCLKGSTYPSLSFGTRDVFIFCMKDSIRSSALHRSASTHVDTFPSTEIGVT